MNNKKVINLFLYALIFIVLGLSVFSPFISKEGIWDPEKNISRPFNGINFDQPRSVSNFKVTRSLNSSFDRELISYDIEFKYEGEDSNMRIIGKLGEQAFFGPSLAPSKSNVVLKGEFDSINESLFSERLKLKEYYKNIKDYELVSTSEVRVPLSKEVGEYKFRISYEPRKLVYGLDKELGKMAVFITNARVDKFSDTEYENVDSWKNETESYVDGNIYVNIFESFDEKAINAIERNKNINNVIFILSVLASLGLIWLDKKFSPFVLIGLILISSMTFYRFFNLDVSARAIVFLFPIIGFLNLFLGRIIGKDKLAVDKYDLSQGLAGALIMVILGLIIYLLPKTF